MAGSRVKRYVGSFGGLRSYLLSADERPQGSGTKTLGLSGSFVLLLCNLSLMMLVSSR